MKKTSRIVLSLIMSADLLLLAACTGNPGSTGNAGSSGQPSSGESSSAASTVSEETDSFPDSLNEFRSTNYTDYYYYYYFPYYMRGENPEDIYNVYAQIYDSKPEGDALQQKKDEILSLAAEFGRTVNKTYSSYPFRLYEEDDLDSYSQNVLEPKISLLLGQDDHDGKSSAELQTDIIREDYPGISDSALSEILRLRLLTGAMVRNRTHLLPFREAVIAGITEENSQKLTPEKAKEIIEACKGQENYGDKVLDEFLKYQKYPDEIYDNSWYVSYYNAEYPVMFRHYAFVSDCEDGGMDVVFLTSGLVIYERFNADEELVDFELLDEGNYLGNKDTNEILPGEKITEDPRTDLY